MSLPARARSVVLPIATFGELAAHGFEIHVWCPRCHQFRRAVIPAERLSSRFAGARFRCRCEAPGYPSFRPGPYAHNGQGDTITDLYCPRCVPPWEMRDIRLGQVAWFTVPLVVGVRYLCPGCRRPILMHTRKEPPTATGIAPWAHLVLPVRPKP